MFSGCVKLTSINLTSFHTYLVKNMDFMFYNCQSLKSIDVSHIKTYSLENMLSMFSYCTTLESIDISNFYTEKLYNIFCHIEIIFTNLQHLFQEKLKLIIRETLFFNQPANGSFNQQTDHVFNQKMK